MWLRVLSHVRPQGAFGGGGCTCDSLTKKLNCPSQDVEYVPDACRGNDPSEKSIRPSYSSQISTPTSFSEPEIVHIDRWSQNECAIITVIGDRSQKALWDSGAGRCIISNDCYNSLHPKHKMGTVPQQCED